MTEISTRNLQHRGLQVQDSRQHSLLYSSYHKTLERVSRWSFNIVTLDKHIFNNPFPNPSEPGVIHEPAILVLVQMSLASLDRQIELCCPTS